MDRNRAPGSSLRAGRREWLGLAVPELAVPKLSADLRPTSSQLLRILDMPDAAEAARDTLGGAVAAADELPDQLVARLLDTAREAFTQGLQLTAITSATIVLGMAIPAVVLLRHARTGSKPKNQAETGPHGTVARNVGIEEALGPNILGMKVAIYGPSKVGRKISYDGGL